MVPVARLTAKPIFIQPAVMVQIPSAQPGLLPTQLSQLRAVLFLGFVMALMAVLTAALVQLPAMLLLQ